MPTAIKPWRDAISAFKNGCFLHLQGEGTLSSETVSSSPANSRILHAQRNCQIFKSLSMRSEMGGEGEVLLGFGILFLSVAGDQPSGWELQAYSQLENPREIRTGLSFFYPEIIKETNCESAKGARVALLFFSAPS